MHALGDAAHGRPHFETPALAPLAGEQEVDAVAGELRKRVDQHVEALLRLQPADPEHVRAGMAVRGGRAELARVVAVREDARVGAPADARRVRGAFVRHGGHDVGGADEEADEALVRRLAGRQGTFVERHHLWDAREPPERGGVGREGARAVHAHDVGVEPPDRAHEPDHAGGELAHEAAEPAPVAGALGEGVQAHRTRV